MIFQKTLRVKNRTIVLPKDLKNTWDNVEVFARVTSDTVILKKIQPSSFWKTWKQIRGVKPRVSKKDIDKAIAWARTPS